MIRPWRKTFRLVPTEEYDSAEYQMIFDKLFYKDVENLNAKPIYDYSFKHIVVDRIQERIKDLSNKKQLNFYGKSLLNKPTKVQIALVLNNGKSFGKIIELLPKKKIYNIPLSELRVVKTVTMPRPYPSFLPYFFEADIQTSFNAKDIESIQISVGPGIEKKELKDSFGISIQSIWLD